jgi:hypothetical protein
MAMERMLQDISGRLAGIEQMYAGVMPKLTRVDHLAQRAADTERTVRELQHISAGAIHETARLVDLVGTSGGRAAVAASTPAPLFPAPLPPNGVGLQQLLLLSGGGGTPSTPAATATTAGLPAPGGSLRPRTSRSSGTVAGLLEGLAAPQVTSVIHQHASQIHKLIAGLDFLEQHILRHGQVLDTLQPQVQVRWLACACGHAWERGNKVLSMLLLFLGSSQEGIP